MIGRLVWMIVGGVVALKGRRKALDAIDRHVPIAVQRQIVKRVNDLADEIVREQKRRKGGAPIDTRVVDEEGRPKTPPA